MTFLLKNITESGFEFSCVFWTFMGQLTISPEVDVCTCCSFQVFLKILQNSLENTCARASEQEPTAYEYFSVNLAEFLRTIFFKDISGLELPVICFVWEVLGSGKLLTKKYFLLNVISLKWTDNYGIKFWKWTNHFPCLSELTLIQNCITQSKQSTSGWQSHGKKVIFNFLAM